VRHTTPLLMLLGGRLPDRLGWLREAVAEYIEEEIGHEEWILNDIAAAGGDAEAVRASRPELPAEVMVAYAYDLINRGNPAGFFGMVFVLEGTSVALALTAADRIQQALGLPNKAFLLPALARHARPGAHQAPGQSGQCHDAGRSGRSPALRAGLLQALRRHFPRPAHGRNANRRLALCN
jgi:hypothetical protein